jgi:ketosteroid isomerase-like protein
MEIWELVVRESVRDVIARYNAYGDSGRMKELLALFAEDALMDMDGQVFEGRQAIRDGFIAAGSDFVAYSKKTNAPRDLPVLRHYTATHVIDATSPTSAAASSYFLTFLHHGPDHWGSYHDEFREIDGQWQITRRRVAVEGATKGSMGAEQFARTGKGGY